MRIRKDFLPQPNSGARRALPGTCLDPAQLARGATGVLAEDLAEHLLHGCLACASYVVAQTGRTRVKLVDLYPTLCDLTSLPKPT